MSSTIDSSVTTSNPNLTGTGDSKNGKTPSPELPPPSVRLRTLPTHTSSSDTDSDETKIGGGEEGEEPISSGDAKSTLQPQTIHSKSFESRESRRKLLSPFAKCMLLALVLRLLVVAFSIWQDATRWPDGQLRFTDVDYDVFTDAALALLSGRDMFEARPTYRYSPLLAMLVAPGHWLFGTAAVGINATTTTTTVAMSTDLLTRHTLARLWGKLVFIGADMACAWLQYRIIQIESKQIYHTAPTSAVNDQAVYFIAFAWLFNPISAIVSVRGNAESVLGLCVLTCLLLTLTRRAKLAGFLFGLCVHLKIYPIIYAPAIYAWLSWSRCDNDQTATKKDTNRLALFKRLFIPRLVHFQFAFNAILGFVSITGACYLWCGGWRFIHQAYLYHFTRVDLKHNFAPHFYPLYLLAGVSWRVDEMREMHSDLKVLDRFGSIGEQLVAQLSKTATPASVDGENLSDSLQRWGRQLVVEHMDEVAGVFRICSLLPIVLLIPALSVKLARRPGLCWFVITYTFVTFNRVCTSQYFLWSLVLLPIALASIRIPQSPHMNPTRAILECSLLWFGAQALWLASAYTLEMQITHYATAAPHIWCGVWAASLVFFSVNVLLIRRVIRWRRELPVPDKFNVPATTVDEEPKEEESKKLQ